VDDNVLVKTFNIPNDPAVDWTWPEIRRVSGDTLRTVGEWFFYAPGADNILGSINPLLAQGRRHMFVKDYRGSVIQTTYEDGQALGIGADWYQPFGGQDAGSTARATEPGYNGHESSGGLVYMRNRWYDPNTGRFTQQDPIGFAGGSNLYVYTGGDPVNFSDPFGLCPYKDDKDGKRNTDVEDCPDGKLKDAFRLLAKDKGEGRATVAHVAANRVSISLHEGRISCGEEKSNGCTRGTNVVVNGSQSAAGIATTTVHEVTHTAIGGGEGAEATAWNRALNFYDRLSPKNQNSDWYSKWSAVRANDPVRFTNSF